MQIPGSHCCHRLLGRPRRFANAAQTRADWLDIEAFAPEPVPGSGRR